MSPDETVHVSAATISASMGEGDDYLHTTAVRADVLDGGPATDEIKVRLVSAPEDTVTGSLVTDRIEWQTASPGALTFTGMEGLHIYALARTTLYGDEGPNTMSVTSCDDTLTGFAQSNDRLDGGEGTDTANGRGGQDSCVAETRVSCEA